MMRKHIIASCVLMLYISICLMGCQKPSELVTESTQQMLATENTIEREAYVSSEESFDTEMTCGVVVTTEADISTIDKIYETVEMEGLETELETAPLTIPNDALVNVLHYIPNIVVDLKYATEDNFTGQQIYNSDMPAMLRYGTVKKLSDVQYKLNAVGYTLVIWDAYRPIDAQFKLWEVCPDNRYVANPNKGYSSHSRGDTVDVTIQTLIGEPVEMPTNFDDFSTFADRDYSDASLRAKDNAMMLEELMELHGFTPYSAEWWHFSDTDEYDVVPEGVG